MRQIPSSSFYGMTQSCDNLKTRGKGPKVNKALPTLPQRSTKLPFPSSIRRSTRFLAFPRTHLVLMRNITDTMRTVLLHPRTTGRCNPLLPIHSYSASKKKHHEHGSAPHPRNPTNPTLYILQQEHMSTNEHID